MRSFESNELLDQANWQSLTESGESAIKAFIASRLAGCTVTCVLIGRMTNERKWVHYEIEESIKRKNAILGVYMHYLVDQYEHVDLPGFNPLAKHKVKGKDLDLIAPLYDWDLNRGYVHFGSWVEKAVQKFKTINHFGVHQY